MYTLVNPSWMRVWAVMRPAAPEPMTHIDFSESGFKQLTSEAEAEDIS